MAAIQNTLYFNILLLVAIVLVFVALMSLGAYFYSRFCSYKLRMKLKKRFNRARNGEKSAEALLKEAGYLIESVQKNSQLPMWINGKQFSYTVRPDAFALREGKRYLVEVKTGAVANNPKHSATRRQLLEYFHGFDVDGVLLVDAEQGQIHNVYFHQPKESASPIEYQTSHLKLFIAFLFGVAAAMIAVYANLKRFI